MNRKQSASLVVHCWLIVGALKVLPLLTVPGRSLVVHCCLIVGALQVLPLLTVQAGLRQFLRRLRNASLNGVPV